MLRRMCLTAGCLVAVFSHRPARAEVLDTTASRPSGAFSIAGEIEGMSRGDSLMLSVHEAVGLAGGVDLIARQGFGLTDNKSVYFGGGLKWTLLHDKPSAPGLAVWAGGHYWTGPVVAGFDATILLDHHFGRFTPYAGLDLNLEFSSGNSFLGLAVLGGGRIGLGSHIAWYVEGGLGLGGAGKFNFISTGPRFQI
ncbi:MAG TPA: hypothetical protein VFH51_05435 [Myxococcota bacterium]|nr:hypothetical protein [Myxococcota bacterium]